MIFVVIRGNEDETISEIQWYLFAELNLEDNGVTYPEGIVAEDIF